MKDEKFFVEIPVLLRPEAQKALHSGYAIDPKKHLAVKFQHDGQEKTMLVTCLRPDVLSTVVEVVIVRVPFLDADDQDARIKLRQHVAVASGARLLEFISKVVQVGGKWYAFTDLCPFVVNHFSGIDKWTWSPEAINAKCAELAAI